MRLSPLVPYSALLLVLVSAPHPARSQSGSPLPVTTKSLRDAVHASPDWQLVAPHLPDPKTSSIEVLETQGDLLRVRRFPEDALDYYGYALDRGGDQTVLFNKIGITQMEMGNGTVAKAYFQRVVKLNNKDPQAWNNLGAVEFMDHNFGSAVHDYKRAIKLNKRFAVSHSNLGMVYIEMKDYGSAKTELLAALKLDPKIFQHSGAGGLTLHMLSTTDRSRFCFQMAKVYARMGNEDEMLHQLETASQAGMDVQYEMAQDADLAKYVRDPRVIQLVIVAKSLREKRLARSTVASELPPAAPAIAPAR